MTCYSDKITLNGFGDIEKAIAAKLIRNGKRQIAVADSGSDLVSFWELSNLSDQILHAAISDLSIHQPLGLAFTDFGSDGLQEFMAVLANHLTPTVTFYQLSDAQFVPLPILPIATAGDCLDLRFVNLSCDFQDILVVPDQTKGIQFFQKSDSSFVKVLSDVAFIEDIEGLAFADTNLDGFDDLMAVLINGIPDRVEFYRYAANSWNPVHTLTAPFNTAFADIDVADFDHDGKFELAVNYDVGVTSTIHFYKMLSDTIWSDMGCTIFQSDALAGCGTVAFGDLTQQGRIDLMTGNATEGLVVYKAQDIATPFLNILQLLLCDCSQFPLVNVHHCFENLLFCVDIDNAPVETITAIFSVGSDGEIISDKEELCAIVKCCSDVEACLTNLYGSDVLNRVSDQWCVTYTGPVRSARARVDLDNCRVLFEDFYILCSDGNRIGM